jgi:ubiquinone/menaquinone biosynthesis C-methylase UbiE
MNDQRYIDKENYILNTDLEYRLGHLYNTIIQEYLPVINRRVLHAGCNGGSTTELLALYIREVVGVDINADAIMYAREHYPQFCFDVANLMSLPYDDDIFEGIYCLDVLEHIYQDDLDQVIRELCRVLKPMSYACFFAPTATWGDDPSHVLSFVEASDITGPLGKHFDVVECVHDTRPNPGLSGHQDHWRVLCRKPGVA